MDPKKKTNTLPSKPPVENDNVKELSLENYDEYLPYEDYECEEDF